MEKNPILNSPYEEPKLHYHTNSSGELDYEQIVEGRRYFVSGINVIPTRQDPQGKIFDLNDLAEDYGTLCTSQKIRRYYGKSDDRNNRNEQR